MIGWISLHRQIEDHWLWTNPVFLQRWLLILFRTNHTQGEMILGYEKYKIERGQCAYSIRTWATLFQCGTKQVTKFFKLLEDDNMIKKETIGKGKNSTTRITIVNYDCYQTNQDKQSGNATEHAKETQGKRKGNAKETQGKRKGNAEGTQYNNGNNGNNDNNDNNNNKPVPDATRRDGDKKSGIEVLLDKIIERYPGNIKARGPMLKALKQLDTEEKKLALKNLDRYTQAWAGYHHNLLNYLEGKQFLDRELIKRETKQKKNHTTAKLNPNHNFSGDYGDIVETDLEWDF